MPSAWTIAADDPLCTCDPLASGERDGALDLGLGRLRGGDSAGVTTPTDCDVQASDAGQGVGRAGVRVVDPDRFAEVRAGRAVGGQGAGDGRWDDTAVLDTQDPRETPQ